MLNSVYCRSKVTSLETQNARLRQEKVQLAAQLEMLKTKVELSEETKQRYVDLCM